MPLSDIELRVLGALIEKDRTTPEGYPLSTQALVAACNQRSNRDPVTDYHLLDVQDAVARLRDRGLAETVQGVGDRVPKHAHRAATALGIDDGELALLAVLLLRGAQTPGELRGRTERYVGFVDVAAVEEVLNGMERRSPQLVKRLLRRPGQSQDRFVHVLGMDEERLSPRVRRTEPQNDGAAVRVARTVETMRQPHLGGGEDARLERRIAELEERVAALEGRLTDE